MPVVRYQKMIFRNDLVDNPKTIYVFGDNMTRWGLGGQAKEMRYEPNSIGVPTKWRPAMTDDSFFSDDDLEKVKKTIQEDFQKIWTCLENGYDVVFPQDGLGTGLSQLKQRSPMIFDLIESLVAETFNRAR